MSAKDRSNAATKCLSQLKSIKEAIVSNGVADKGTFVELLDSLGAAEAACTRWLAETIDENSEVDPPPAKR